MKNKMPFLLAVIFLSAISIKADAMDSDPQSIDSIAKLDGYKWYLTHIHLPGSITRVTEKRAFIRFNTAKGSAGGNGSCNSFGATISLKENGIRFSDIFSTKMYCEAVQSIENDFLRHLQKVTKYSIVGKKLLLYEKEILLLEFEGIKAE